MMPRLLVNDQSRHNSSTDAKLKMRREKKSLSGLENCPKSFRLISFNQEDVMEKLPFYNWGKNPFGLAIFTAGKV